MEIYRGKSQLDNGQIVAITTQNTHNRKTGDMVQIWILAASMNPYKAVFNNIDRSICGDCKHRGKTCYVALHQAPLQIYRKWLEGFYPIAPNLNFLKGKVIRLGSYGDPVALPFNLVKEICHKSDGWTGYTHQWNLDLAQKYNKYLMASVDNLTEYYKAKWMGWRTFRVKEALNSKLDGEIVCPAAEEAGKKSNCFKCQLCSGLKGKDGTDIVINVHGLPYKHELFKKISLQLI